MRWIRFLFKESLLLPLGGALLSALAAMGHAAVPTNPVSAYQAGYHKEAVPGLEALAKQRNPGAQAYLCEAYLTGNGTWRRAEPPEVCFDAARAGVPLAMGLVGGHYLFAEKALPEVQRARKIVDEAAAQGDARAVRLQGDMRFYGIIVQRKDTVEAASFYQRAYSLGDRRAGTMLGIMYLFGHPPMPIDYAKAHEFLSRAAEGGDSMAQYHLGELYDYGVGVEMDLRRAEELYRRSAERRYVPAQLRLGERYRSRSDPAFKRAAAELLRDAGELGSVSAQYQYAMMMHNGELGAVDPAEVVRWWRACALQNNVECRFRLAAMHATGRGVPVNYPEAIRWLYLNLGESGWAADRSRILLGAMVAEGVAPGTPISMAQGFVGQAAKSTEPGVAEDAKKVLAGLDRAERSRRTAASRPADNSAGAAIIAAFIALALLSNSSGASSDRCFENRMQDCISPFCTSISQQSSATRLIREQCMDDCRARARRQCP
jgi:TPR repeat protein